MTVRQRLARLDDRLVPLAAARLRQVLDAGTGLRARLRVPRAALALLVTSALLATAGVAVARGGAGRPAPTAGPVDPVAPGALGPVPGSSVAGYLSRSRAATEQVARTTPRGTYPALVSFTAYHVVEQLPALLPGVAVRSILLRAPVPGAPVLPLPVTDLVPDVRRDLAGLAARTGQDATQYAALAATLSPATPQGAHLRDYYRAAAATASRQAAAYRGACPCVFAALVVGPAAGLAALLGAAGVRAVEVGAPGDPTGRVLRPLLPEARGRV